VYFRLKRTLLVITIIKEVSHQSTVAQLIDAIPLFIYSIPDLFLVMDPFGLK